MREAIARLLEAEPDLTVVGHAAGGRGALAQIGDLSPGVVLMDGNMRLLDTLLAIRWIHDWHPLVRVVVLSRQDEHAWVQAVAKAGALAYVPRSTSPDGLFAAIRAASGSA
jgi:DNA-binding NarL/FixJ family response regulator